MAAHTYVSIEDHDDTAKCLNGLPADTIGNIYEYTMYTLGHAALEWEAEWAIAIQLFTT